MDFEEFQRKLLSEIKSDSKACYDIVDNNKELLDHYLYDNRNASVYIVSLVENINDAVVYDLKKFKTLEKVLKHTSFQKVLGEFRESDVLIRACKIGNKKAVDWLLTMNMNIRITDNKGMTAFMYAVQYSTMLPVIEFLLKIADEKYLNIKDINGNTAIFHAIKNKDVLEKMLEYKKINIYHINNNNENLFMYACKNDYIISFNTLIKLNFDFNLCSKSGKTAAMYLEENGRQFQLKTLVNEKTIYDNYGNKTFVTVC
ncbi:hypothetical protein PIROE2DRAFT_16115 [Piromyces sp. E2]|nr:hypothetical protein PIROE2DRAFT_16115 [Piromyces sp. E2]|eukprot:OUM58565.1 hypothetical protein PIROE2DRAFT_16115 [Piromyces sp. E2]